MTRTVFALALVSLGAVRDPCGTETTLVGVDAPCQRSTDCARGLSCAAGTCAPPDAGDDGSPDDAPSDADGRAGD